jgi:phage terminase large subunit GpA-like protein
MKTLKNEVSKLLSIYFKRAERLLPSEWVQKYIRLSHRQSRHKGLYNLNRTPYFREIYDVLIDTKIRSVVFMKSAQVGYSQFVSNMCFYYICNYTNPIAIIFPSQALAQQWGEKNLHGGIDTCEPLQDFITGDIDDLKRTDLTFKSANLKVIGGGSATKLSSNNICYLFLDEVDKYKDFLTEASVVELAIDRTITYQENGDAKVVMGSTPSMAGDSEIEKHYKEGSQSKFHVPCPHCQHEQELVFSKETIKFDNCKTDSGWDLHKVEKETYYECSSCHKPIREAQKAAMINKGRWVETNLSAPPDCKSYHISALYSLSLTWGSIARDFLMSKSDRGRLQNFYNSKLGLPWKAESATVSDEEIQQIIKISPEYKRGEIPSKAKGMLLGVDVQHKELYFLAAAVLEDGHTAVVDWGQCAGFEDLAIVAQRSYKTKGTGEAVEFYAGFIDAAGGRTNDVYRFCKESNGFMIPTFGKTAAHQMFSPIRRNDIPFEGGHLTLITVNDRTFSTNLLLNHLNPKNAQHIYLPTDTDEILSDQLTAVSIVEKKDAKGFVVHELLSKRNNHLFDCLKLCNALHYCVRGELEAEVETQLEPVAEEVDESKVTEFVNVGW